jgi:hypothetical protein
MPRGKPTAEKLASYAYGMGAAAAPFTDTFTKAGLAADFVAQLNTAADAVVGVVANRTTSRGKRRGATDGLKARLTEGRKVVHILDALVKSALKNDAPLLGNWNLVKRVTKSAPGRPAGSSNASPPAKPKLEGTSAATPEPTPPAADSPPPPLAGSPPVHPSTRPPADPSTSPPETPAAG